MHFLRRKIPLQITTVLLERGPCLHKDILENIDVSASTLSYHLSKMKRLGMVEKVKIEHGRGFKITEPGEVMWLLMKGKIEPPTVVDGFISTMEDFY